MLHRHSFQTSKSNLEILVLFGIAVPLVTAVIFGIVWLVDKLLGS